MFNRRGGDVMLVTSYLLLFFNKQKLKLETAMSESWKYMYMYIKYDIHNIQIEIAKLHFVITLVVSCIFAG